MSEAGMWPLPNTQYDVRAASTAESLEYSEEKVFSNPQERFEVEVAEVTSSGKGLISTENCKLNSRIADLRSMGVGFEENCLETVSQLQEHIATYHDPSISTTPVEDSLTKTEKASFLQVFQITKKAIARHF